MSSQNRASSPEEPFRLNTAHPKLRLTTLEPHLEHLLRVSFAVFISHCVHLGALLHASQVCQAGSGDQAVSQIWMVKRRQNPTTLVAWFGLQQSSVGQDITIFYGLVIKIRGDCHLLSARLKEEVVGPCPLPLDTGQINDTLSIDVSDTSSLFR